MEFQSCRPHIQKKIAREKRNKMLQRAFRKSGEIILIFGFLVAVWACSWLWAIGLGYYG